MKSGSITGCHEQLQIHVLNFWEALCQIRLILCIQRVRNGLSGNLRYLIHGEIIAYYMSSRFGYILCSTY